MSFAPATPSAADPRTKLEHGAPGRAASAVSRLPRLVRANRPGAAAMSRLRLAARAVGGRFAGVDAGSCRLRRLLRLGGEARQSGPRRKAAHRGRRRATGSRLDRLLYRANLR